MADLTTRLQEVCCRKETHFLKKPFHNSYLILLTLLMRLLLFLATHITLSMSSIKAIYWLCFIAFPVTIAKYVRLSESIHRHTDASIQFNTSYLFEEYYIIYKSPCQIVRCFLVLRVKGNFELQHTRQSKRIKLIWTVIYPLPSGWENNSVWFSSHANKD